MNSTKEKEEGDDDDGDDFSIIDGALCFFFIFRVCQFQLPDCQSILIDFNAALLNLRFFRFEFLKCHSMLSSLITNI